MNRFRRLQRDDEGASLILVLAFLLAFTLIVPALLGLAQTNVMSVAKTRAQGDQVYDADAVAQKAVNDVRNSGYNNAPGQACFTDPSDPSGATRTSAVVSTSVNDAVPTLVTCQPGDNSGDPTKITVPITDTNRPGAALITTSTNPGEDGVVQKSNNVFRIQGRVYSNSTIKVTSPSASLVDDNAPVYAVGACSGKVLGTPTACNDGTAHSSYGVDPAYPLPTQPTTRGTVPSCKGKPTGSVFTLNPGYYTDATALSALNSSSCKSSLTVFKPGVYYFDFGGSGSHVWSISDGYVIGGTAPTSGARAWTTSGYPAAPPTVPGACVTPLESTTNGGVEFVFGGDSQVSVTAGAQVELCGQYSASTPPVVLYGVATGTPGPDTTLVSNVNKTADESGPGKGITYNNRNNINSDPTTTADAVFDPTATGATAKGSHAGVIATIKAGTAVPAGQELVSATLTMQHRDVTGTTPITALGATLTTTGITTPASPAAPITPTPVTSKTAPLTTDSWDFTSALANDFTTNGFNSMDVDLTSDVAPGTGGAAGGTATEQVATLQLTLVYRAFGYRSQALAGSCTGNGTYPSGAGCATVSTNGPGTALYFQGTTYLPKGALDITLNNISQQVFKFGLVCRTLQFSITGSSSFDQAVISVPDYTPGFATVVPVLVYFQAYLCPSGSCTAPPTPAPEGWVPPSGSGWVRRVSAVASFADPTGNPVAGNRRVSVRSWYSRREGT